MNCNEVVKEETVCPVALTQFNISKQESEQAIKRLEFSVENILHPTRFCSSKSNIEPQSTGYITECDNVMDSEMDDEASETHSNDDSCGTSWCSSSDGKDEGNSKTSRRNSFTGEQIASLENNRGLTAEEWSNLAASLNIPEAQAKNWFYNMNRPAKSKKQKSRLAPHSSHSSTSILKGRKRTPFTGEQVASLENMFETIGDHMLIGERLIIATSLGLTEEQVKIWFKNRRAKCRKQKSNASPSSTAVFTDNMMSIKMKDRANETDSEKDDSSGTSGCSSNIGKALRNSLTMRRDRTPFTCEQLASLEKMFKTTWHVSTSECRSVAASLSLTEIQVKNWFDSRKAKWEKPNPGLVPPTSTSTVIKYRMRTVFTCEQLASLENTFKTTQILNPSIRRNLAANLSLTEKQIAAWFMNKRAKLKKQKRGLEPPSSTSVLRSKGYTGDPNDVSIPVIDLTTPTVPKPSPSSSTRALDPSVYTGSKLYPNDILNPGLDVRNLTFPTPSSSAAHNPGRYAGRLYPPSVSTHLSGHL